MATTTKAAGVARKKAEVRVDDQGNLVPGPLDAVSYAELAVLFKVAEITPHQWRQRVETTRFPENDDEISGLPVWRIQTVCKWGDQTGRPYFLTADCRERLGL